MQDWYLRYQLASVEGVSEVASVGGFVKQYQVTVDPTKLRAYNLSISEVAMAVKRSNGEVGGRSIELAEKEFILRVRGYIEKLDDLRKVAVGVGDKGVPILLGQVANVQLGPDMRRGIAELNGEGETVGGIVVVRYGANARQVILDVKKKLDQAMKGLPPDVTYTSRLRPQRAHRARGQDAGGEAPRGKHRRGAGLPRVPAAPAQRVRGHRHPADRGADLVPRHVRPGHQLQHHVAGRHRHRHRRDGGCGHHHDRERPQAPGARPGQEAALGHHPRCLGRGRADAVLLAAGHHRLVHPGLHAAGAGGPDVQAAGLHQDLFHGARRRCSPSRWRRS